MPQPGGTASHLEPKRARQRRGSCARACTSPLTEHGSTAPRLQSGAKGDFRVKLRLRTSCGTMVVKYRIAVSGAPGRLHAMPGSVRCPPLARRDGL